MASLRDLGLSEYEARAFRSLLDTGPTTAKELSRGSDVPMERIYGEDAVREAYEAIGR
jgi:sugar-specific transcriptional regulator TrmB